MEDIIIDTIYEELKNYSYESEDKIKNTEITKFTNILGNEVIKIKTNNTTYIVTCEEIELSEEE